MTELTEDALMDLVGGPVATLGDAQSVEPVTAADVDAAAKAAAAAEAKAGESERAALAGKVTPAQAANDREGARFARLRHQLAQRKAERHLQAERLRQLDAAGQDALRHAAALKDLRDATLADLAAIEDLRRQVAGRIAKWNGQLAGLIGQAEPLGPEKPRPGMVPAPSSAHVYAAANPPVFVVRHQVLHRIREDHPDGPVAAIDGALETTRQHNPAERLLIAPNGLVTPFARDPGGHLARRVERGELRELTLPEKERYFAGETVSF